MIVYLLSFGVAITLCLVEQWIKNAYNNDIVNNDVTVRCFKSFLKINAPVPLLFVVCFRYGVGYDYIPTYLSDYAQVKDGQKTHSDFGFNLFYHLSQFISDNPQWLFIITGFLIIIGFYCAIRLSSVMPALSMLLFFIDDSFFRSISMIAQYLAIAFFLVAFSLLFNRRRTIFTTMIAYVLMVFACTIHISGVVVFLVILTLDRIKISNNILLLVATILPVATLLLHTSLSAVIQHIYKNTRYASYENSYFQGQTSFSSLFITGAIMIFMAVVILIYRRETSSIHHIALICESIAFTMVLFQTTIPLMYRMSFYFSAFHILTLPAFIKILPSNILKACVTTVIVLAFSIWFILYPVSGNYDAFLPYRFVFNVNHLYY